MAQITSGTGDGSTLTIHPTAKAARALLYDTNGNPITLVDRTAITPGGVGGVLNLLGDYKTTRTVRGAPDGSIRASNETLLLYDECEGGAYNQNKWIQTATTMTASQSAATGVLFNAGSSVASTVGIMHLSHRRFPKLHRGGLVIKFKTKHTAHYANNLIEMGFGSPASATAATLGDGAFWRKDGTGQYVPVIAINNAEILGTPVDNSTVTAIVTPTDYFNLEIQLFDDHAHFIISSQSGVIINSQDLDWDGVSQPHFAVTHLQAMYRMYNSAATSTAVQMYTHCVAVYAIDCAPSRTYREIMSGQGDVSIQSPTAYTQLANWTNNAAPTTRTPTNTAAGESTLGGIISWNNAGTSFAASDTLDLILFGVQVPVPYTFFLTGIRISTVNLGAANGAAIYTIQYGAAFGASAVSLATAAPYPAMRVGLGFQRLANAAAIGECFDKDTIWTPGTPIAVQPSRYIHIIARVIGASAATASQVIRTAVTIDGWFE